MKPSPTRVIGAAVLTATLGALWPAVAVAQTARAQYSAALEREPQVRTAIEAAPADATSSSRAAVLKRARALIATYEGIARRHRSSGYADNALWNGASIAEALHDKFFRAEDRATALRLYRQLVAEYPTSSLVKQTPARIAALEESRTAATSARAQRTPSSPSPAATIAPTSGRATLTAIERTVLPASVRITLQLDHEVPFHEERLTGPSRVFFDLKGVRAVPELADAVLRFPADPVRQIRVGRHPDSTVRVVLDLEGVDKYSVFTLYNPFRVVIDCESAALASRATPPATTVTPPALPADKPVLPPVAVPAIEPLPPPPVPVYRSQPVSPAPAPVAAAMELPASRPIPPAAPTINTAGGFSLARQLGLGVSRVVIDPGHGGHDPGAQARGLTEAELTLDIALKLEKLLQQEPGIEVILTRRANVYIPLEERTAIANREGADLFLSIHANASRNATAGGVETYFLSFAASPEAEAVAARENSASVGEMRQLPDIIKAIALNNKLDESKDLAAMVQEALVTRLRRSNRELRNLGVKKAPFVVLIGAGMPSVLAEVSFLTNKQEAQLLKTTAYKQRIADALHAAVMRYRRSLKGTATVTER